MIKTDLTNISYCTRLPSKQHDQTLASNKTMTESKWRYCTRIANLEFRRWNIWSRLNKMNLMSYCGVGVVTCVFRLSSLNIRFHCCLVLQRFLKCQKCVWIFSVNLQNICQNQMEFSLNQSHAFSVCVFMSTF